MIQERFTSLSNCWRVLAYLVTRLRTSRIFLVLTTSIANIPTRSSVNGDFVVRRYDEQVVVLVTGFSVAAPRVWNRLPTELKQLHRPSTFRCNLGRCQTRNKVEQLYRSTLLGDKVACLTSQVAQLLTSRAANLPVETISILRQFLALSPSCDWSIVCYT